MRSSMKVIGLAFVVSSAMSAFGNGCMPVDDSAEKFREPLPLQEEVALRVPGGKGGTGSTSQGLGIRTETGAAGERARYYQLTRDLTASVDFGTAVILGGIWAIVHTTPTSIESKKAVWGPGAANALEPAIWRFTVTEVGDAEYDYVLEGQPKQGGTWLAVLTGHGYGKSRAEHKQGWFKADNEAYKTLEPTRGKDEGSTKVTFDLRQLPATIDVELRANSLGEEKGWADVKVTHDTQGAGSIVINGLGDLDSAKNTKLEDIALTSRWTSNGSGRADVLMKNGDLDVVVEGTECWSTSFSRVYYTDSVNYEPTIGDASQCAFTTK